MKYIAKISIVLLALWMALPTFAQAPKKEVRAFWLSTVWRLTWPQTTLITETGNAQQIQKQKDELTMLLDSVKAANCNTVYFQVRGRCDAMYRSSYEPWSSDLVATRGMDPGYDPLEFVVEEGHKRGIEVHAWFNPYRYESVLNQWDGTPLNYRESHPDWLLDYSGSGSILNPAMQEVRDHITAIIEEVVENYDIDGVVFDDYFYMSGTTDAMDNELYQTQNPDKLSRGDWRRQNVNKLIAQVYQMIQSTKPYVRFGISPAGVWCTDASIAEKYGVTPTPAGSGWAYNDIFCDPMAWIQEGTIDYISPQIYWTIGSSSDYTTIAAWWSEIVRMFGLHFYSSHSASSLSSAKMPSLDRSTAAQAGQLLLNGERVPAQSLSSIERTIAQENLTTNHIIDGATAAFKGSELVNQIKVNRTFDETGAPGSVFYNMRKVTHTSGMLELLRSDVYKYPALVPAISWKATTNPGLVSNMAYNNGTLSWTGVNGMRYAIYAVPEGTSQATACREARYLLGLSYETSYTIPADRRTGYTYAVAIVDRYGNEYAPLFLGASVGNATAVSLTSPADGASAIGIFDFTWSSVADASYYIDVARDNAFADLILSREVTTNSFASSYLPDLEKGTYYWRVRTRQANCTDATSATYSFNGGPFEIESPVSGSTSVSTTPTISWTVYPGDAEYRLEINTYDDFRSMGVTLDQRYSSNSTTLSQGVLVGNTKYYARVTAYAGDIEYTSPVTYFTTEEAIPDVPVILFPTQGATVEGPTLQVRWAEEPAAKTFRIELHTDDTFSPVRNVKRQTVDAFVYETEFEGLADGVWYLRARSEYAGGETEYCNTISFTYKHTSGIDLTRREGRCQVVSGNGAALVVGRQAQRIAIDVANLSGQIVAQFERENVAEGDRIALDLLPRGVYALIVTIDGQREILKLIK